MNPRIFLICVCLVTCNKTAAASQTFTASSSTTQARIGRPFQVRVAIAPSEDIRKINIDVIVPLSFKHGEPFPAIPEVLAAGSSFETSYTIEPPTGGESKQITHEIVFDVTYSSLHQSDAPPLHQVLVLPFDLAQDRTHYLLYSLLGVLVGAFIKILGKRSATSNGAASKLQDIPTEAGVPRTEQSVGWLTSVQRFLAQETVGILSILLVGFVVLLALSKDQLPAKAFYDSIALGAAIGILSDDQLLTRVRSALP